VNETPSPWDGHRYQERFDALAARGLDVHGEVGFLLERFAGACFLDAGCGTGRVAIELVRRGCQAVGVDIDPSMLATARQLAPDIEWIDGDVATVDLGRRFDVVVMAGNVPLFTGAGRQQDLVTGCARHLRPRGALVAGFQLGQSYSLDAYDAHCQLGGLTLAERYATWDAEPLPGDGGYAVSVHTRA
jgi:SAM-dependent methyltransferase